MERSPRGKGNNQLTYQSFARDLACTMAAVSFVLFFPNLIILFKSCVWIWTHECHECGLT